jgi:hypothetical protein
VFNDEIKLSFFAAVSASILDVIALAAGKISSCVVVCGSQICAISKDTSYRANMAFSL